MNSGGVLAQFGFLIVTKQMWSICKGLIHLLCPKCDSLLGITWLVLPEVSFDLLRASFPTPTKVFQVCLEFYIKSSCL